MRFVLSFALLLLLSNCNQKEKVPAGVLSREKMEEVMWDMMQADQFVASYIMHSDTGLNRTAESTKLYQQVFAIHNISKEELSKSMDYYRSKPEMLKDIMDSLARTKTIAPTAPIISPGDSIPSAGEERLVQPKPDSTRPLKRKPAPPAVPVN